MCHSDDSRPPAAIDVGSVASRADIVLDAADGNRFAAHAARAGERSGARIVVLPDVRGLHEFYRELAARFAEVGVDAVALDYFGRTAGIGDHGDGFDFMTHLGDTTPAGVAADTQAAAPACAPLPVGPCDPCSLSGSVLAAGTPGGNPPTRRGWRERSASTASAVRPGGRRPDAGAVAHAPRLTGLDFADDH